MNSSVKEDKNFLNSRFGQIAQSTEWPPKTVKIPILILDEPTNDIPIEVK